MSCKGVNPVRGPADFLNPHVLCRNESLCPWSSQRACPLPKTWG